MEFSIIQGHYETEEALHLLTRIIHSNIEFHKEKLMQPTTINVGHHQECITKLQRVLYEVHRHLSRNNAGSVNLAATLKI